MCAPTASRTLGQFLIILLLKVNLFPSPIQVLGAEKNIEINFSSQVQRHQKKGQ